MTSPTGPDTGTGGTGPKFLAAAFVTGFLLGFTWVWKHWPRRRVA